MPGRVVALRLDDVGAASKRHEVYGLTRVPFGRWQVPFPGNVLFLKYLPPIKRWGPYRELNAGEWDRVLVLLEGCGARMTVAITAGWVEQDGHVVPFPVRFPDAAAVLREGVRRGFLEVANHGYSHCLVAGGRFLPRWFSGNREWHREFYDWLPPDVHREHLARAQGILGDFFGAPPVTLVPPGNVFARATLAAAAELGIRYVCCRDAGRFGAGDGVVPIDDADVVALHDRDLVLGGVDVLTRDLRHHDGAAFVMVRELGERLGVTIPVPWARKRP
jgi:peptidoglycan/xylan/chitin deacetylase (PgdA/CDA1 family)